MSADNWDYCPHCRKNAKDADPTKEVELTLREDYEIGIFDDDTFRVSYHAQCKRCNYELKFKHEEAVLSGETNQTFQS